MDFGGFLVDYDEECQFLVEIGLFFLKMIENRLYLM